MAQSNDSAKRWHETELQLDNPNEIARGRRRHRDLLEADGAAQRAAATSLAARVAADELSLKRAKTGDAFEKFCGELMLSQKLSAVETQQLAQSGKEAGASGVDRLARAGKSGELPGNTHRDAMRALLKNCQVPEPYYADVHLAMTYEHRFLLRTSEVNIFRTYVLLCPPPSTIFTSIASYGQV